MTLASKTQAELEADALRIGMDYQCVLNNGVIYLPQDYERGFDQSIPVPERTVWVPFHGDDLARFASQHFGTLFKTEKQKVDFNTMVEQCCTRHDRQPDSLLVKRGTELLVLGPDGQLSAPTGSFVANTLPIAVNEDKDAKLEVWNTLVDWLDDDEDTAHSLLHHAATSLAPGWSAGKYVLLIGSGRNGKSVFLDMMRRVFGAANCASVTRQDMAKHSPVVVELNGALLNVIMDGPAEFLKDSSAEKTLIVGEELSVRMLYRNTLTKVQTNAMFLEGLNREPNTSDKSQALQARMVRFHFVKTFSEDRVFYAKMMSEPYVGALLSLLIDHYVTRESMQVKLQPTKAARDLQFEHMHTNSIALQYVMHLENGSPLGADDLVGTELNDLYQHFCSWRLKQNDLSVWEDMSVKRMFNDIVDWKRTTKRDPSGTGFKGVYTITGFKRDALAFLDNWRTPVDSKEVDTDESAALVEG